MRGGDVQSAQRLLKNAGYYSGEIDGDFGPLTAQASCRAQYWLGYVTPKQAFGPSLEKLLSGKARPTVEAAKLSAERKQASARAKPLREKALAAMEGLVGLGEAAPGSRHVPDITGWWGKGDIEWCALAVSKAYIEAGSTSFSRGSEYQYVPYIVADARQGRNGLAVTPDPKPGDLVCFDWDGSDFTTGDNHVGMFASGTAASFRTIDGNIDGRCDFHDRTAGSAPRIVFVHVSS
jgi:peptidoglycan hydrolase-like protein with peptidoglycan-binding domain